MSGGDNEFCNLLILAFFLILKWGKEVVNSIWP